VLEEIPVGVDGVPEIHLLDRTPDRISVQVDEHGGRGRPENLRRVGLDALDVLHLQRTVAHVRHQPVQVEHALALGERLHLANDGLHLIGRERLEVELGDPQVHADHAIVQGHACRSFNLDGPERGFLGAGGQEGHGGPRDDLLLAGPAFHLWLVPHRRAALQRGRAGPPRVGVGADRRRRRGGRRGRLGLRPKQRAWRDGHGKRQKAGDPG
jgi:hypothetical protein